MDKEFKFGTNDSPNRLRNRYTSGDSGELMDIKPKQRRKLSFESGIQLRANYPNVNLIKICFTGGPCAGKYFLIFKGKTTALSIVADSLRNKGHTVLCVPEAATIIFSSGGVLNMSTYSQYQGIMFQQTLMKLQISLEQNFQELGFIKPDSETVFILCDRGLMDGSAFVSKEQFDVLLDENGLDRASLLNK